MRIAFYAPMKAPDHPVPSGDRRIAGLLLQALRLGGHDVEVASRLRSHEGRGDGARQRHIRAAGRHRAAGIAARYRARPPDLWFTYHLYHKAPDWIGPAVSRALAIPYLAADASHAAKQASGPWRDGHRAAAAAIRTARRVLALDPADLPGLAGLVGDAARLVRFPPFLDIAERTPHSRRDARHALARAHGLDTAVPWLAAVAMMRPDAKRCSYRLLAAALSRLGERPWRLLVAGDGAARAEVEALFPDRDRVRFLGRCGAPTLARLHAAADLAVWPALKEGTAMALLEAQGAGLAVAAGDRPGLAQFVRHGETGLLAPEGDAPALAAAIATLLDDPQRRRAMGARARRRVSAQHGLATAARRLDAVLRAAAGEHRR